jgi:hypothetical protein
MPEHADTQQPMPCVMRVDIGNGITKTMRGYLELDAEGELTFTPAEGMEFRQMMDRLDGYAEPRT